jgi:hypothetical protein
MMTVESRNILRDFFLAGLFWRGGYNDNQRSHLNKGVWHGFETYSCDGFGVRNRRVQPSDTGAVADAHPNADAAAADGYSCTIAYTFWPNTHRALHPPEHR